MKKYKLFKLNDCQLEKYNKLIEKYNLHPLLAKYLIANDINNIEQYINPTLDKLDSIDELLNTMKDLKKAYNIFKKYITTPEKILVVGDYDADGITSSALIYLFFKERYNINIDVYIPERKEGYGLSKKIIDYALSKNKKLIITVDNGISAFEAVEYAKSNGIEVIITDHHAIQGKIPNADAIVNPQREDCNYRDKYISGVGVAFNFIRTFDNEFSFDNYMPILAIGTVADVVPLLNNNRIFVYNGINKEIKNKGLRKLLGKLGIENYKMTSTDISYKIAPIINSAGREGKAYKAFELFINENDEEIEEIIDELLEMNSKRKERQTKIENEILKNIQNIDISKVNSITIKPPNIQNNYDSSIVGIVASRIVEKTSLPVVIFGYEEINGEMLLKGSGRGVEWFDFRELIEELKNQDILITGGGHKLAAGFTIKEENFEKFIEIFERIAQKNHTDIYVKVLEVIELPEDKGTTKRVMKDIIEIFETIEPVGEKNKFPIIAFNPGNIYDLKTFGKDTPKKHFYFRTESGIRMVCFNKTENGKIPDIKNQYFIADVIEKEFINEQGHKIKYYEFYVKDWFKKTELII